ncbi:histidine--tRNA ligase [Ammoniphilus sp. CFH 90114]|uniref:histidine--tRNA ligase n=1 Tax=Ammoniphilus sp. CFH 90114 TaxID=2493665 RepID=UPI00100F0A6F|nr:histidine--tRNA ligase [Ammoniphilus sp. CFH 90114]RXT08044.1 histidine--tRNA ligase [Ammoniphilus sp. CFH 90114]
MSNQAKGKYRPQAISGFPEWLPEQKAVELMWMDTIRKEFESFGYACIETPSVEELNVLTAKGEIDKEIYVMQRLHAEEGDEARLGLHYDLTVPFARYVAQHYGDLVFPFKRYQMQKVWRGERAQVGRYREFYQCDIDVIHEDTLPLRFDSEMPRVMFGIFQKLGLDIQFRLNNRKVLQGYFLGLGIEEMSRIVRAIDKWDKLGEKGVLKILQEEEGLTDELAQRCVAIAKIKTDREGLVSKVQELGVEHPLMQEGLEELDQVLQDLQDLPSGAVIADLSIARGLDYYTGTVYESSLIQYPELGSVCSGGRYENLAGSFIDKNLSGVGMSIGLSRVLGKLFHENELPLGRKSPTDILVVLPQDDRYAEALAIAAKLRENGHKVEVFPSAVKFAKQIRYASRKGIPYVWFLPFEPGGDCEVKNLITGNQELADPAKWKME